MPGMSSELQPEKLHFLPLGAFENLLSGHGSWRRGHPGILERGAVSASACWQQRSARRLRPSTAVRSMSPTRRLRMRGPTRAARPRWMPGRVFPLRSRRRVRGFRQPAPMHPSVDSSGATTWHQARRPVVNAPAVHRCDTRVPTRCRPSRCTRQVGERRRRYSRAQARGGGRRHRDCPATR